MPVIEELICTEQDGTISFGNYKLGQKAKKSDFEYQGDMYKVKTYNETVSYTHLPAASETRRTLWVSSFRASHIMKSIDILWSFPFPKNIK